jgi:hypothetical protein
MLRDASLRLAALIFLQPCPLAGGFYLLARFAIQYHRAPRLEAHKEANADLFSSDPFKSFNNLLFVAGLLNHYFFA